MSGARVPEHAASIETPEEIVGRIRETMGRGLDLDDERVILRGITIDRDQIRRALGFALIGEAEMPRECLRRVRDVLAAIGGAL